MEFLLELKEDGDSLQLQMENQVLDLKVVWNKMFN